jgi:hypothetical protein
MDANHLQELRMLRLKVSSFIGISSAKISNSCLWMLFWLLTIRCGESAPGEFRIERRQARDDPRSQSLSAGSSVSGDDSANSCERSTTALRAPPGVLETGALSSPTTRERCSEN